MVLIASTALAAETGPLTWDQCVAKINSHPPVELTAASAASDSADALSLAATGDTWPRLSVNSGFGMLSRRIETSGTETVETETKDGYVFGVSGNWPIYPRFDTKGKIQEAQADVITQRARQDEARVEITFALRTAFYELLFAQEALPLAGRTVDRRAGHLNTVQLRYDAGRETKAALFTVQAALSGAKAEVTSAEENLQIARKKLVRLLSLSEAEPIMVTGSFPVEPPPMNPAASLAQSTPESRIAAGELARAIADITSVRSAIYPELDAVASYSPRSDSWSNADPTWFAGLWLKYTFFSGGSDRHKLAAAKFNRDRAEARRESVVRSAAAAAEQAFAAYSQAIRQSAVQIEVLKAAELRAETARIEYEQGTLSFSNWELIEMDLINQQKAFLKSKLDCGLAQARWARVTGLHIFTASANGKE
jgi:outer membrane protein TolC